MAAAGLTTVHKQWCPMSMHIDVSTAGMQIWPNLQLQQLSRFQRHADFKAMPARDLCTSGKSDRFGILR